tara:strand:+ start:7288 stop:7665 length:378 start_codon:yes stop_codon:yes gene_type:complete
MEKTHNILGLLNPGTPSGGGGFLDSLAGPVLIVGVALALGVIILLIVLAMHHDGGGSSKSRPTHRLTKSKPQAPGEEGERKKRRKRHKRRRRDHRKRNPTLSETGGLPPRDDKKSGDGSSASGES